MITLSTFMARNTGLHLDWDRHYGAQCVDLIEFYLRDVLGLPPLAGNAVDEYGENSRFLTWTHKAVAGYGPGAATSSTRNPTNRPPYGSIVVWGPSTIVGTGVNGHTAIALNAYADHFISFDQNWPVGSPCHQVKHTYPGVIGWAIPRTSFE